MTLELENGKDSHSHALQNAVVVVVEMAAAVVGLDGNQEAVDSDGCNIHFLEPHVSWIVVLDAMLPSVRSAFQNMIKETIHVKRVAKQRWPQKKIKIFQPKQKMF